MAVTILYESIRFFNYEWLCLYPVNLSEAIELLDVVSDFNFENSDKRPRFSIYDSQKEGFVLCVKANLVSEEYRDYLMKIVDSRKLGLRESEGYMMIHGY